MPQPITPAMGAVSWAMLITLSVLWGGSFFLAEVILEDLPPFTLVWLRVAGAAATLWLVVAALRLPIPRTAECWLAFLGMGFLNNVVPFSLIVWGQTQIGAGLAAILNATTPLFGVVVAGLVLADERATAAKALGVGIGFLGVVVMLAPDVVSETGMAPFGPVAVLGGALAYACSGVYGRRFRRLGVVPTVVAAGQVLASTLLLAPVVWWIDDPLRLPAPSALVWASVAALAVLSTALAYILYFQVLATAGAVNAMLVTLLVPVTAILLGSTLLGEALTLPQLAGMALIALGLSVIDGRVWTRRTASPRR